MDDELNRTCRRWHEAEASDREEDAEVAFRALFATAVTDDEVPARFTAATMARVADAAARDARRSRLGRRAAAAFAIASGAVLAWYGAAFVGSLVATAIARGIGGLGALVVGLATAGRSGA